MSVDKIIPKVIDGRTLDDTDRQYIMLKSSYMDDKYIQEATGYKAQQMRWRKGAYAEVIKKIQDDPDALTIEVVKNTLLMANVVLKNEWAKMLNTEEDKAKTMLNISKCEPAIAGMIKTITVLEGEKQPDKPEEKAPVSKDEAKKALLELRKNVKEA